MSNKIKISVNGRSVLVTKGILLSDILNIEKPCGGNGTCGKCKVLVNGNEELACKYTVTSEINVKTRETSDIISEVGVSESGAVTENLCFALDIGTTTLALALVSLDEKKTVKVETSTNPQRRFGADVISRIDHCRKNSVDELHTLLITEINRMISEFNIPTVDTMYVSANVTMLHTFFGVDCSSIGVAPYTPSFLDGKKESARSIGLNGVKEVISLPSVSSFVGADIVAGLNLLGMPESGKYNLLVDLGTNAEIVLYSSSSGVATAAAAGPCFEGANISCGMSATKGAIYAFDINYGHPSYKTISDAPAVGICGTGLIDLVAALLRLGTIDEGGYMEEDYHICQGVYLSPEDVRQYQLAKSAVHSAILSLMSAEGIGFEDISKLYVSGGFSAKVNLGSAARGGLIPPELLRKTEVLNNSSLQGTIKYACGDDDTKRFIGMIKYVDLSTDQYFSQLFIDNMMFDETSDL